MDGGGDAVVGLSTSSWSRGNPDWLGRGTATMKLIDPDNGRSLTVARRGGPGPRARLSATWSMLRLRNKADLGSTREAQEHGDPARRTGKSRPDH